MDYRPLLRVLAVVALVAGIALGAAVLRSRSSRTRTIIAAGLTVLAVVGFVLSSLDALQPRAPVPGSATLYYTQSSTLIAAAAETGTVRWQRGMITVAGWPPALANSILYLGTPARILALRASDGTQVWATSVAGSADAETPAADGDVVYATSSEGVYALRTTDGSQLWHFPWPVAGVGSSPHVAAGVVYAALSAAAGPNGSQQATIYALGARDGAIIWKHTVLDEVGDSLTVADGAVYVRSLQGIAVLDAADGTLRWQIGGLGFGPPPAVAGGVVYVGALPLDTNPPGIVLALDERDGSEIWRAQLVDSDDFAVSLAVSGSTLYAGGGSAYALRASDGHMLWRYGSGARFSQPVLAHGVVFIGSSDPNGGNSSFLPFGLGSNDYLNALDAQSGGLDWRTSGAVSVAPVISG